MIEEQVAADDIDTLRMRAELLERQLAEVTTAARSRLVHAELKAEAIRAGIVDMDGLKLIDPSAVKLTDAGEVEGAGALMQQLKRDKPWLFGQSSSSVLSPPLAAPAKPKMAMEMTVEEWRAARAELLKRR